MRPVQAQTCGMLQRIAAGGVEPVDQGFEINDLHGRYPVAAGSSEMEALLAQHQRAPMKRAAVYSVSRGSFRLFETTGKPRWRQAATRLVAEKGSGLRCVPGILCLNAVWYEGFNDGLIGEGDRFHVAHGLVGRVQTHGHKLVHGSDDGVLDFDGVVKLFLALRRDAVVLELGGSELFTRGERLEKLGRGLVDFLRDGQRAVDTLAGGQTRLQ